MPGNGSGDAPGEGPDDGSPAGPPAGLSPHDDTGRISRVLDSPDRGRHTRDLDEPTAPRTAVPVTVVPGSVAPGPAPVDPAGNGRPTSEDYVTEPWAVHEPPGRPETIDRHDVGEPGAAVRVVARPVTVDPEMDDIAVNTTTIDLPGSCRVELRAASLRGRSHQHYRTPRQDDHTFRVLDDRFLVAAVADGVSAGARSAVAARTVVHEACERLIVLLGSVDPVALPWSDLMEELCDRIVARCGRLLGRDAMSREDASDAMATTVALAVIDLRCPEGDLPVHVARLGDTTVARLGTTGSWTVLLAGKSGSDGPASSATAALPRQGGRAVSSGADRIGPGEALVLLTDGVGDPLGDGGNDVGAWFAEQWRTPPTPLQFAAHVDFARRSFDDDRTALVVWHGTTPARRRR